MKLWISRDKDEAGTPYQIEFRQHRPWQDSRSCFRGPVFMEYSLIRFKKITNGLPLPRKGSCQQVKVTMNVEVVK